VSSPTGSQALAIGVADVAAAATVLEGVARRTPVVTSRTLDELVGARVFLKAENLQRAGAFKFRGAYTKIASLDDGVGVLAFSSGNHAQAVALASRLCGHRATILMPEDAPRSKLEATRGYGAEVVAYDRYTQDREALGEQLAAERGLELVRPYDDALVMAGQATAALELLDEVGELDLLLTPVGGGGLLSGSATIAKSRGVARVVGVEPAAGDDLRQSLARGERVRIDVPRTIADGLQTTQPGVLTFEVIRRLVDDVVTVTDEQLVEAMRFAFERLKLVIEPSGAAGIAALLSGAVAPGERVGIVVSGGNVGAERFAELLG
jgi:threonine dehydratase